MPLAAGIGGVVAGRACSAGAAALLAFGRPPLWALVGGAARRLAVAVAGGPLP